MRVQTKMPKVLEHMHIRIGIAVHMHTDITAEMHIDRVENMHMQMGMHKRMHIVALIRRSTQSHT